MLPHITPAGEHCLGSTEYMPKVYGGEAQLWDCTSVQ